MERTHKKYERLLNFCKSLPPTKTAVAHPCDESSLRGAVPCSEASAETVVELVRKGKCAV